MCSGGEVAWEVMAKVAGREVEVLGEVCGMKVMLRSEFVKSLSRNSAVESKVPSMMVTMVGSDCRNSTYWGVSL